MVDTIQKMYTIQTADLLQRVAVFKKLDAIQLVHAIQMENTKQTRDTIQIVDMIHFVGTIRMTDNIQVLGGYMHQNKVHKHVTLNYTCVMFTFSLHLYSINGSNMKCTMLFCSSSYF